MDSLWSLVEFACVVYTLADVVAVGWRWVSAGRR